MRRCLSRYLPIVGLLALALDCAALIACIGIYRTDWYVRHSGYYYDSLVERRFELADPVDVLIVGDSSALLGAIPRVIESETAGLKVFNPHSPDYALSFGAACAIHHGAPKG